MELGDRVRERRQQLGLSLRDLAERSELTASFLSQVERGVTSPSIDSLRRVANALDVPVFHFLLEPDRETPWCAATSASVSPGPVPRSVFSY